MARTFFRVLQEMSAGFGVMDRVLPQKTEYDEEVSVKALVIIKIMALLEGQHHRCRNCMSIDTMCLQHEMRVTNEEVLELCLGPKPFKLPEEFV